MFSTQSRAPMPNTPGSLLLLEIYLLASRQMLVEILQQVQNHQLLLLVRVILEARSPATNIDFMAGPIVLVKMTLYPMILLV